MNSSYPESYFHQLNEYLRWQTERIRNLEGRIELIERELDSLKGQRGVTIERIEYKFDQLKVETLEGTLNVGLSPTGLGLNHWMTPRQEAGHRNQYSPIGILCPHSETGL